MSDDGDLFDKIKEMNRMMETASLLPDRQYIIFNAVDEDNVSMSVYDTTDINPDDTEPTASDLLLYGVLEMLETRMDDVLELGIARLEMIRSESQQPRIGTTSLGDNVVKVDFGKKH